MKRSSLIILFILLSAGIWTKAQTRIVALVNLANTFAQVNSFAGGVNLPGTTGVVHVAVPAISLGETFTLPGLAGSPGYALCIGSVAGHLAYCIPPGAGSGTATVNRSPTSLSFGSVVHGTSSSAQTILVGNTGTALLNFTGSPALTFTGTNASMFSQTNNCSSTLDAGWACVIAVTFSPTSTGAKSATLNISDSATGSPQLVTLSGTGT
jgi:hypothetical protein